MACYRDSYFRIAGTHTHTKLHDSYNYYIVLGSHYTVQHHLKISSWLFNDTVEASLVNLP
jgi:hypothetical protein